MRTFVVLATVATAYFLWQLSEIIVVLFVAVIFASAIRPFVDWLSRHGFPLAAAILSIYLLLFAALLGLLALAIPPLISLTIEFFTEGVLVTAVNDLLRQANMVGLRQFQVSLPVWEVPPYMQAMVVDAAEDTAREQAWPVAQGTLLVLGQALLAFVIGFYWLVARADIQRLLLRLVPYNRRADVELIWNDVEHTLGAYVRGQGILMVLIGVLSYAGLLVLGVDYPLALAVIAGITEAIPVIGPILGAVPAVVVGFTVSPIVGILVAVWYLVLQQLEGNVLVPKVMQDSVGLNPLVVILALTAGAALNGVVGAILSIPLAGAAQVLVQRLWLEPAIEKSTQEAKEAIHKGIQRQEHAQAEQEAESATSQDEQPASKGFQQV